MHSRLEPVPFGRDGTVEPDVGFDGPARVASGLRPTLVIACGALARELVTVMQASRFANFAITCLPAILHNHPERIAPAVRAKIRASRSAYSRILCLFGDCGTGGELDRILLEEGVERIEGAHCYQFFAGSDVFSALMEDEPGTFFLTDYLARHFDRLVVQGLGLDRFPELRDQYFGHYRRLVYLAQSEDGALVARAQAAAVRLGLAFDMRPTGYRGLADFLGRMPAEA